jgi:hypothetical protein
MTIHLRETVHDPFGEYVTIWHCKPPDEGQRYRVIREEWSQPSFRWRHVYEVEVTDA